MDDIIARSKPIWARLTIRTGDTISHKVLPLDVAEDMQRELLQNGVPKHSLKLYWPIERDEK